MPTYGCYLRVSYLLILKYVWIQPQRFVGHHSEHTWNALYYICSMQTVTYKSLGFTDLVSLALQTDF